MIKKKTTLILGAGASKYFGYPTGEELFSRILDITKKNSSDYGILKLFTKSEYEIDNFRTTLINSGKCSIDEFLEHRTEFNFLGKCAIALAIIPFENQDNLFKGGSNENWYKFLNRILNSESSSADLFSTNQISFITFNYDRSLEQFLFTIIKNSFPDMNDEKCTQVMDSFPIIHLHGTLGYLPYKNRDIQKEFESVGYNPHFRKQLEGKSYRAYSPKTDYNVIKECIQNLKIIHDDQDSKIFEYATELLQDSERIYFLGFGYNTTSLRRLRISDLMGNKLIAGTAYGMGKNEITKVYTDTHQKIEINRLFNCGIVDFFKDHMPIQ